MQAYFVVHMGYPGLRIGPWLELRTPAPALGTPDWKLATAPIEVTCSGFATTSSGIATRESRFSDSSLKFRTLSLMGRETLPLRQLVSTMRILIADDSAVVRERLTGLLTSLHGIEVIGQAEDAMEAKRIAEKLRPDVAILDLRMPKGSGADVLSDIKKLNPTPKVIILTNYAQPENRKKCMDGGADYFFDKSTEFQKMISVLMEMLPDPAKK